MDAVVRDECTADITRALHYVEEAGRQTGFDQNLGDLQGTEGR